jgi:chemotaxis protein MotB
VIAAYPERLVVRGHTDGRPYKSGTYDNWRLSTARAHMAYYMLVRGGIDEKRFERIEGHADRHLKILDDPEAAQNRRIEILLRKVRP